MGSFNSDGAVRSKSQSPLRWLILVLACLMMIGNYYCYDNPAALKSQVKHNNLCSMILIRLMITWAIPEITKPCSVCSTLSTPSPTFSFLFSEDTSSINSVLIDIYGISFICNNRRSYLPACLHFFYCGGSSHFRLWPFHQVLARHVYR